jgi:acetyl esterase/lipase
MEDGRAVLIHILKHGSELNCNPASMSLGGISAGGHLSAVMQHMARDAGIPLKLGESPWVGLYVGYPNLTTSPLPACLSVPTCDYQTYFPDSDGHTYPSVITMAKAPCLDASRLAYFRSKVFSPDHQAFIQTLPVLWRAPLHAKNFKGLCDTYLSSAQCDPLVDEGEAYGRKVLEAGGKVTFRR